MSNLIQIKVAELNQLNPLMIAEDNRVEQKFIQMYNAIWGTAQGAQIYEKEKFNFRKILQDKPELQRCTPLSLYGCFLDIAVNGLSLDPTGRPHCYILPRSTKTGYKDNNGSDIYELRAYLSITGYGELVMRQRAGQVRYVDNPVVCYEGDTFSPGLIDGVKTVTYQAACPRKSNKVIGGFLRIVRSDGTVDWHWMMEGDIKRLEAYSFKNNQRWNPQTRQKEGKANALYTSSEGGIDPGFLGKQAYQARFRRISQGTHGTVLLIRDTGGTARDRLRTGRNNRYPAQSSRTATASPPAPIGKSFTRIRRATASGTGTRIWYNSPNITRR